MTASRVGILFLELSQCLGAEIKKVLDEAHGDLLPGPPQRITIALTGDYLSYSPHPDTTSLDEG